VAEHGAAILSTDVAVTPTRDPSNTEEVFVVVVKSPPNPGTYGADFSLQIEGQAARTVRVDFTFDPVPSVDSGLHSKRITLRRVPRFFGAPPDVQQVDLVQNGDGDVRVRSATVSRMETTTGNVLPIGAVAALIPHSKSPAHPLLELRLNPTGSAVKAGQYSGALTVGIQDQARKIEIPVDVLAKDGPWGASIVLAVGFLAALLFGWWTAKGKPFREVLDAAGRLQAEVKSKWYLQADDRTEAIDSVESALRRLEWGSPPPEIQKLLLDVQNLLASRRTDAQNLVNQKIKSLLDAVRAPGPGALVRGDLEKRLQATAVRLERGEYKNVREAGTEVAAITGHVDRLEKITADFDGLSPERKESLRIPLDEAKDLDSMQALLLGRAVPETAGFAMVEPARKAAASPSEASQFTIRRSFVVNVARVVIALVTAVFVLVVGFVTLYLKNSTFGADTMDYVTLFLWGSTVEAVRGQTAGFEGLKAIVKKSP
jgi:hypothetical protein